MADDKPIEIKIDNKEVSKVTLENKCLFSKLLLKFSTCNILITNSPALILVL